MSEIYGSRVHGGGLLIGIAASGRTPYVLGRRSGCAGDGSVYRWNRCSPGRSSPRRLDIAIELISGPEVVTGSTRMKAGTATKLALNMITTGSMIRLGYVYGNLMVNVQPRNEKLRIVRSRIVRDACRWTTRPRLTRSPRPAMCEQRS